MGERHQIFVVARVCIAPGKPRQYRCIAALHDQWCCGESPLRCVNSFKRLARVPENAALINEEIATYHERKEELPQRPCPYTSLLAESAFSVDLERKPPYLGSGVWNLDVGMGSSDEDNDDGITILDVTVPRNPAYCFVFLSEHGTEDDVPGMTPLTAAQYLRCYYPVPEASLDVSEMRLERDCLEDIANLDDMPLIPIATLANVWPREYAVANDELQDSDASSLETDTGTTQLVTYPTEIDAFRRQSVLSSEDMTRLKNTLKGAMHPDAVVDLSRFPLTADQILSVLEELGDFKRLDVSHSQAVDSRVFLHILKSYKRLRWINILHCPISMDDLKELMTNDRQRFRSIETILHPAFLTGKLPVDFPKAFLVTYILDSLRLPPYRHITLPFFSTDQLVQNIFDILSNTGDNSFQMPSLTIMASSHLAQGLNWSDRAIQLVPGRNLDDNSDSRYYLHEKEVYQLVVRANEFQGMAYGILTPLAPEQSEHTDSDVIEMDSFLKRLEEEGSPAADAAGVKRLLELCANTQLISMDHVTRKRYY
ncbi:hypothetical protein H1R20_g910, partial [Candolleomyces eurysporus]